MMPEQIATSLTKARLNLWMGFYQHPPAEHKVCPHCETWELVDCMNGRGCPTPDGMNGQRFRNILKSQTDGE